MSTAARVAKNTGYLYAKMGITMFISLYTTRLILNSLGTSDFGIFNIVGGAIAMLGFLNAAMAGATQRFMSYTEGEGDKEKQKKIFNISIILHAGISVIVGVVLLCAGYIFFNGVLNIPADRIFAAQVVYGSLIVSTMFTVMSVPYDAMLNAHENMRYYAIVGIIESLLKLSVAFVVVYTTSDKLIMYGILMAAIPLVTLSIMRIYCHRKYAECVLSPRRYFDRSLMKEMTGFAGWNFFRSSLSIIGYQGQSIVLNHFWGSILNAANGIVSQIQGQLLVLSNNLLKAIRPLIVKSEGENNREKMLNISIIGSKLSFLLLLLPGIPFIVEAPTIFTWWLKKVPDWTITFFYLSMIKTFSEQIFSTLSTSIEACGNIKAISLWCSGLQMFSLLFSITLFYLNYPPYWLYISYIVFCSIGTGIVYLYYCGKLCNLSIKRFIVDVICRSITLFLLVFIISYSCKYIIADSATQFLLVVAISFMANMILGYMILLNKHEQTFIKNALLRNLPSLFKIK